MSMAPILIGAALLIGGVLHLLFNALRRRPLSNPHQSPSETGLTLEPSGQGMRFLGLLKNWVGLVMIAIGIGFLIAFA